MNNKQSMSVEEYQALRQSNIEHLLIDVREQHEYDESAIEGSILIPLDTLHENIHRLDKHKVIVMQCRSGRRSASAQEYLLEQGFTKVFNLEGGILAWDAMQTASGL